MRKLLLILILDLVMIGIANCQKDHRERITADTIDGIYIPRDLNDCFKQIDVFWNDSLKQEIRTFSEEDFCTQAHFGFGMWMRNNWQLWSGSRLSKYFNDLGIHHPDDMSGIILTSYHRYLLKKEISIEEQIQYYKDYWTKAKLEQNELEGEFNNYNVGDTVFYNYLLGFSSPKQEKNFLNGKCIAKGIVVEMDSNLVQLKVRLIESCGKKGIISFDFEQSVTYDNETGNIKQSDKKKKYLRTGEEDWFNYLNWQIIEK